jgi:hypothetical protein
VSRAEPPARPASLSEPTAEQEGWGIDDPEPPRRRSWYGAPGVGGALKRALVDFYYHSIRLVVANVAWGLVLLAMLLVASLSGILPALVVAGVLGVAWVGVVRLAVLIARNRDVVLSDAFAAWRRWLVPGFVGGTLTTAAGLLLWLNVIIGVGSESVPGWALTTLAGWGLLYGWFVGLTFWPLLLDPERDGGSARSTLRLAALVVLARPIPIAGLGLVLGVLAVLSTATVAAIVTVSAAYIALAASHLVLPLADELEARMAGAIPADD